MTYIILLLIFSGCLTGVLAGLLGIGGGIIIVPVLAFIFHQLPETTNAYMQFAAGTSLGIMIFTALSSVPHKLRAREVSWDIARKMLPWIVSMNIVGAVIAHFLNSRLLGLLFALLMLSMFVRMLLQSSKPIDNPKRSGKRKSANWKKN